MNARRIRSRQMKSIEIPLPSIRRHSYYSCHRMAGKVIRVRCVSPSLTHARVRQILRKLRAKIKRLEWLPSQWQSPEPLGSRRFPNHNLSTSFLDHPSKSNSSLFSSLPLEIRLRIYELVLEASSHPSDCSDQDQNPLLQAIRREPINCLHRVPGRLMVTTPFGHQLVSADT